MMWPRAQSLPCGGSSHSGTITVSTVHCDYMLPIDERSLTIETLANEYKEKALNRFRQSSKTSKHVQQLSKGKSRFILVKYDGL